MHPRPDWFNQFKYALLRLIVCTSVATFTYTGYFIPIFLGGIRVDFPYVPYIPMIAVIMLSIICLAPLAVFVVMQLLLAMQYEFVNKEYKNCCGVLAVVNTVPTFVSIMSALGSGPIGTVQFWDIVGQCFIWFIALLHGLLSIGLLLYYLALVWLENESAQSSCGTADGQPIAVVVIQGESTSAGTPGTRAAPGSSVTPGSTAASSAT